MKALRALLGNAIDYAGLFPPATLDMGKAVENYSSYCEGEYSWMLGRFIVPVPRLDEFKQHTAGLLPPPGNEPWKISALCRPEDLGMVERFNEQHNGTARIDVLEIKGSDADSITRNALAARSFSTYFEIPVDSDPHALLTTIKLVGGRAKVRAGGISENLFPKSADLIRFMKACSSLGVPFKATAGLHHPIRARYPLTYDATSQKGMMYGFLNLLFAASFISTGLPSEEALDILNEQDPREFRIEEEGIAWKKRRLTVGEIASARQNAAISFGSCSFIEPVDELKKLGFM